MSRATLAEARERINLHESALRRVRMVDSVIQGAMMVGSEEQWEIARCQLATAFQEAAELLVTTPMPSLGVLSARDRQLRKETQAALGYKADS